MPIETVTEVKSGIARMLALTAFSVENSRRSFRERIDRFDRSNTPLFRFTVIAAGTSAHKLRMFRQAIDTITDCEHILTHVFGKMYHIAVYKQRHRLIQFNFRCFCHFLPSAFCQRGCVCASGENVRDSCAQRNGAPEPPIRTTVLCLYILFC